MKRLKLIQLPTVHIRSQGDQLDIILGDIETEFGMARSAWLQDRLLFLGFYEDAKVSGLDDLRKRLDKAHWHTADKQAIKFYNNFCNQPHPSAWVMGTLFQQRVWHAVCQVPEGDTVSYSQLALNINQPKAVRAVGSALGANNIAYWVPCHRAVRSDGSLGGYRWGLPLKARMLNAEATAL